MSANKLLTSDQFERAVAGLTIADRPVAMARKVLVEGMSQADCARALGVSRNAVSLAVNRVRDAHDEVPAGFERVTAILPLHQASVVKSWTKQSGLKWKVA